MEKGFTHSEAIEMIKLLDLECTKCGRRFKAKPPSNCKACNAPQTREVPRSNPK